MKKRTKKSYNGNSKPVCPHCCHQLTKVLHAVKYQRPDGKTIGGLYDYCCKNPVCPTTLVIIEKVIVSGTWKETLTTKMLFPRELGVK